MQDSKLYEIVEAARLYCVAFWVVYVITIVAFWVACSLMFWWAAVLVVIIALCLIVLFWQDRAWHVYRANKHLLEEKE